jgi:hypothetical protein
VTQLDGGSLPVAEIAVEGSRHWLRNITLLIPKTSTISAWTGFSRTTVVFHIFSRARRRWGISRSPPALPSLFPRWSRALQRQRPRSRSRLGAVRPIIWLQARCGAHPTTRNIMFRNDPSPGARSCTRASSILFQPRALAVGS